MTFDKYIDIAKALRPNYQWHRCFHCAFILKKARLVAIGVNQFKSHPRMLDFAYLPHNTFIHAELSVVLKSKLDDFSNCKMIVLRINNNNQLDYSKYCGGCTSVVKQLGFKEAWYSTQKGFENLLA